MPRVHTRPGSEIEPDPRFTLANERTYLAWIRTALALLAAGIALDALAVSVSEVPRRVLALALVVLGVLCAVVAHVRWRRVQQALRRQEPLPTLRLSVGLGYALGVVGIVLIFVL